MSNYPIVLDSRRELFWDDSLLDCGRTTASLLLHHPVRKEVVLELDRPWEGDGCDYFNFFKDEDRYRMYYLGWQMLNPEQTEHTTTQICVCYAESQDGIHWERPNLGLRSYKGSTDNNILLGPQDDLFDNFFVFKDDNPACPPQERYKGVAVGGSVSSRGLWCYLSADGIHFFKSHMITDKGKFDTLNTALWDSCSGKYLCYLRDFHNVPQGDLNAGIRDIRWIESEDFRHWSEPVLLDFQGGDDYPLYTNNISPYYRAEGIFTGFPTRYVERREWNDNFEQLSGAPARKQRMKIHPRYGLATTDCVFMSSRDGKSWRRWDDAFYTPGPEWPLNWVYGDCYPALGMAETVSDIHPSLRELSMFGFQNHWSSQPAQLFRMTMRIDGFVSLHAGYRPQTAVTKPFTFTGNTLSINFSTSAMGSLRIRLLNEAGAPIPGYESCELFGDSLDRKVAFSSPLSSLSGQPVRMELRLSDGDIYSFIFQ